MIIACRISFSAAREPSAIRRLKTIAIARARRLRNFRLRTAIPFCARDNFPALAEIIPPEPKPPARLPDNLCQNSPGKGKGPVKLIFMHETPPEIQAASIIAAATIYAAAVPKGAWEQISSSDEAAKRVAEIAAKILANFTG